MCRCGAGQENTAGLGDTPGFPLQAAPSIVVERQRCKKLRMPRNHPRVTQSSSSLLQTWRANCDIQILIYDSPPQSFDSREISKVTDYVVAYSCKGNATYKEELETYKKLIMAMEETTGDEAELTTVCKKIINKASSSRLISKQEVSLLLANGDLTVCSDTIETVSISDSSKVSLNSGGKACTQFLSMYARRPVQYEDLSLHQFYPVYRDSHNKKSSVPHFTGINGQPVFPVTEEYARHVLIVYKPWRDYPKSTSWKSEFKTFIHSAQCPPSCKLSYDRVVQRFYDGTTYAESKTNEQSYAGNTMTEEDKQTLILAGLGNTQVADTDGLDVTRIHRGLTHPWDKPAKVSSNYKYGLRTSPEIRTSLTEIYCRCYYNIPAVKNFNKPHCNSS